MFRKVLYLSGFVFVAALLILFYRQTGRPVPPVEPDNIYHQKKALLRLEDVSPGVYDTEDKLEKLKAIADYLHDEGVPFHVSLIPYYKDPGRHIDLSIADTGNPQIKEFDDTIRYLQEKGGIVGLHGYTHQYQAEVSGAGYEFMEKGSAVYARASYAEERVKKALELAEKAGITVDYWETPHYTGSPEQYQAMSNYFGLMYEPNPREKSLKTVSSWDSTGPGNQGVIFVPAPLLNVTAEKDVNRILGQLDKDDQSAPASFFYHPFQEFRFMYKMKAPEGYSFYAYEPGSYLHRLVGGFKERGYTFVTVFDVIHFLPAQRVTSFNAISERALITGDFNGDGRTDMAAVDLKTGRVCVAESHVDRPFPRNNPIGWGKAGEWLEGLPQGGLYEYLAGDFNGDGFCDLAVFDIQSKTIRVALSDGQLFVMQDPPWGVFPDLASPGRLFTGDFDGDGKCDLLYWSPADGDFKLMASKGYGFGRPDVWLSGWEQAKDVAYLAGDFNGDGMADVAMTGRSTGEWRVALSNGRSLVPSGGPGGDGIWLDHFAAGGAWQFAAGDFNGGGKDDIAAYDKTAGRWEFARSTGRKFVAVEWPVVWGKDAKGRLVTGDFNGDGKCDFAVERRFGESAPVDTVFSVINRMKPAMK
ncbi:MAG: DUF2334 domain-containing protein [Firmicutes bacterium]|nr:DUF2334 domain-containing protein [Bacillota bacterium]